MPGSYLGDLLVAQGYISSEQRDRTLAIQQEQGGRLGDILIGEGAIGTLALYQAIAAHERVPFINLVESPADPDLIQEERLEEYLYLRVLPYRRSIHGIVLAACEITPDLHKWAQARYGARYRIAVTSPFDIFWGLFHLSRSARMEKCMRERVA